jgi:O-antigen/teichoic acid export membrane protein
VAFWCSGQAPALLAASLLTPVAAAVIRACQYLATPLTVALTGLDGILAPRASRIRATGGEPGLRRFLRLFALGAGAGVILYAVVLLPFVSPVMDLVYKGHYSGYSTIVAILLLDAFLSSISRAPILRLKVLGDTRRVFIGYLWAAGAGLSSLLLLAPLYGILGAAAAAPIASFALLCYLTLASRSARALARDGVLVSET